MNKKLLSMMLLATLAGSVSAQTATWPEGTENIAAGCRGVYMSGQTQYPGKNYELTDGILDNGNKLMDVNNDNCWVVLDLGAEYNVTQIFFAGNSDRWDKTINIYGYDSDKKLGFKEGYNPVELSKWTKLCTFDNSNHANNANAYSFLSDPFTAQKVRYIMYKGTDRMGVGDNGVEPKTDIWGTRFSELKVAGTLASDEAVIKTPAYFYIKLAGNANPAGIYEGLPYDLGVEAYNEGDRPIPSLTANDCNFTVSDSRIATVIDKDNTKTVQTLLRGTAKLQASFINYPKVKSDTTLIVFRNWPSINTNQKEGYDKTNVKFDVSTTATTAKTAPENAFYNTQPEGYERGWLSKPWAVDPQPFYAVDLGKTYNIKSLAIQMGANTHAEKVRILTSNKLKDGQTEFSDANVDWAAGMDDTLAFNHNDVRIIETPVARDARYVKIVAIDHDCQNAMRTDQGFGFRIENFWFVDGKMYVTYHQDDHGYWVATCTGAFDPDAFDDIEAKATQIDLSALSTESLATEKTFRHRAANPNAFVYDDNDRVRGGVNTIPSDKNNYQNTEIQLFDGIDFGPREDVIGSLAKAEYVVKLPANRYSLIYLPFSFTDKADGSNVLVNVPEGLKLYDINQNGIDTKARTITLTPAGQTIDGVQKVDGERTYIAIAENGGTFTFEGTKGEGELRIGVVPQNYKVQEGQVFGVYRKTVIENNKNHYLFNKDGNFRLVRGGETYSNEIYVNAFAGYITIDPTVGETAAPLYSTIVGSGDTTGMTSVAAQNVKADGVMYNISGQRVSKDYKGLVIKNGKKYLLK